MNKISEELWQKAILPLNVTIKDIIQILEHVALKIVMIANESKELIGTITDGDIRRGLLKGLDLNSPIDTIINRNPKVVNLELGNQEVIQMMKTKKIQQIPIINENKQILGLHSWDDLHSTFVSSNTIVIMAGGKGTRLHPKTLDCPKPLIPISGKPILEHIIDRARKQGFNKFILVIHYLGKMIEDYFGNGEKFGVDIEYLYESSPLGTAGSLSLLKSKLNEPFIVTNGDVITKINYSDLINYHKQNDGQITVAIKKYELQNPYGVVYINGINIVEFEEKPINYSYVNGGVYVFDPAILNLLEISKHCDMPTLLIRARDSSHRLIAYPIHESWIDLGRPEDLEKGLS